MKKYWVVEYWPPGASGTSLWPKTPGARPIEAETPQDARRLFETDPTAPQGVFHQAWGVVVAEHLERVYAPPVLFIFEEVELGGGYHELVVCNGPERDWSEPYSKSGIARYRNRVVKVDYPPKAHG